MKFIDPYKNPWHALGGEDGPPVSINPDPYLLLDLTQWHAVRASWPAGVPVGLKLANDQDVEDVAADLPRFALIALHFPKWVDGRAYSQARLLRERFGFAGELRATGQVLPDQLLHMRRCGFDAFEIAKDAPLETWKRALEAFSVVYQPAADGREPINSLRRVLGSRA